MRGKYRTANIILTVILLLALAFHIFTASVIGMTEIDSADWNSGRAMELTGEIYAEKIGTEYQGNKKAGYEFYRIKAGIRNIGTEIIYPEMDLFMSVEGEEYDDVLYYYEDYEEKSGFVSGNEAVIPAGQTGIGEMIVQVREGVSEIRVVYYEDYADYGEEESGQTFFVALD